MCAEPGTATGMEGATHLILMSRAPLAGATKTRLSPPLTPEQAREFHAACLMDLIDEAARWQTSLVRVGRDLLCHLFITPESSEAQFRRAGVTWPAQFRIRSQVGRSLGERMAHAISDARGQGSTEHRQQPRVILAGSDLPLLSRVQWEAALAALDKAQVVFGPAPDGGYYLIAMRTEPDGLFDLAAWGGASVLADSLRAAASRGRRTACIETLPDADTFADLRVIAAHPLAASLAHRRSVRLIRHWIEHDPD
ncbi:MAG: TIGR04282 family arsenosugar biosynthesis glycosyltransferase [SAR324 cluster bacterium]|nr:TIGR04282 family arsenosugar biosynthesis glycosyltransferase [SAR324 cluster bacterium]